MAAPKIIWEASKVDYVWPSASAKQNAIDGGSYLVEKNVVTGVKYWQGVYYLTVPRWFGGVPSTLNAYNPAADPNKQYLLQSWPSWGMNKVGDCHALQYVQSMEIDSLGRMWVIDVGSVNIFVLNNGRLNACPPKLVIIDIASSTILRTHIFSPEVASYTENFLNDIVVDQKRGFAYITDTQGAGNNGGLIVYDYMRDTARRYTGPSTMIQPDPKGPSYAINGYDYSVKNPSDTIALSADASVLFYGALSGTIMYQLPTAILRDFLQTAAQITAKVQLGFIRGGGTDAGNALSSQCDGMATSAAGGFFYGSHPDTNSDLLVKTSFSEPGFSPATASTVELYSDYNTLQWVDTLAWKGNEDVLIFSTNRLQSFFFPQIHALNWANDTDINFRVFELSTPGHNTYLNAQQQQPPMTFPSTGGANPANAACAGAESGGQLGWLLFAASGGAGVAALLLFLFFSKKIAAKGLADKEDNAQAVKNQL
jgi:hypothetical protein